MKKKLLIGLVTLLMGVGLVSCGPKDGKTPYIGENGNWWIGNTDTGIPAQGPAGDNGSDGSSVTVVSVEKTETEGLVDTYTITFSDGTITTFTVTNGESSVIESIELTSSSGLVDTYTITFTNGSIKTFTVTNGKDGENGRDLTITSIELKSTEGLIDTYVINYSDGSKFEFVVSNGADGKTPHIGENGNWWIGDTDTGVLADWEKANNVPLTIWSNGLKYETWTINGKTGYVVTAWWQSKFRYSLLDYCLSIGMTYDEWDDYCDELLSNRDNSHLVIPNYIGNIPVIGVDLMGEGSKLNFEKITLSSNTVYICEGAFESCDYLKTIDFNNAHITTIPASCFEGTSIESIVFPDSVECVLDSAFNGARLTSLDLNNVKYIGDHAFDDAHIDYVYIKNNVNYVGNHAFDETFIYLEADEKPSNWGNISSSSLAIITGVNDNGDYLYSLKENEVTIYQYLGQDEELIVPAEINGAPVTKIGSGFNTCLWNEDLSGKNYEEIYNYFKSINGYIKKITIGNNVREIDKYALLYGNMFIYIEDSVEKLWIGNSICTVGCFYKQEIEETPTSLIVIEDTSDMFIHYNNTYYEYSSLPDVAPYLEIIIRGGVAINDIYYDSENKIYYIRDNNGYELSAYKDNYVDNIVLPESANTLPVKTIGKYAFAYTIFNKLTVSTNTNKIKSYAFYSCYGKVFIPNSVDIINANGMYLTNSSIIYTDAAAQKDEWDSNWNPKSLSVQYSTSKAEFDNL